MAAVTGKKLKNTYKDLLQISNANSGIDTTLRAVEDCEGTTGALSMSTTVVGVLDGAVGAPGLEFKDDPDNGIYRIGANNWGLAVAGALAIELDPIGAIQMPLQPMVSAFNTVTDSNVTGNGTTATIDFNSELKDQNNDFTGDTMTFPVDGQYLVTVQVRVSGITNSGTHATLTLVTSNRYWYRFTADALPASTSVFQISAIVDADATDTMTVTLAGAGEASDVWDIFGYAGSTETYITISLLA